MKWERTAEDYRRHGTQRAKVLAYLREGHPLTQDEAMEMFGCRRLASRISELRRAGWLILSVRNRQGTATYLLLGCKGGGERA